jgi:hypothetical protein
MSYHTGIGDGKYTGWFWNSLAVLVVISTVIAVFGDIPGFLNGVGMLAFVLAGYLLLMGVVCVLAWTGGKLVSWLKEGQR